jgi:S-formylglutathione hydrolase FrmB
MRKLADTILALCLTLLFAGCAEEPVSHTTSGSITEIVIPAPSLQDNLLGDSAKQRLSIYLPPGYDESPDKRYSVLYLLHGFTGTNRTWMIDPESPNNEPAVDPRDGGYQQAGFLKRERLDSLIAAGVVPELIIVAPNGRNAYKHSFYVNSPVTGRWEDYIVEDVVGFVDANYRTLQTASSRGIAGHSGGANGALFIAMRHPDVFGSVYAMAPCCSGQNFSLPLLEDPDTGQPTPFWQDVYTRVHALSSTAQLPNTFTDRREDFYVNAELAASAAFAPNPDLAPLYGDYLFEMRDGALVLNESALERRLALSVYRLIGDHESDLRSLRGILIDYGEHEMQDLVSGNSELANVLARRGIPFLFEVYADGDHGNMVAQRLESRGLKFFADTLEFSAQ